MPEPKTVVLSRPERAKKPKASNKGKIEDYRRMLRRRWAEANPILYDGLKNTPKFARKKKMEKAQGAFYRIINWGRFSRFLKFATKDAIINKLINLSALKMPYVAGYAERRRKNRDIQLGVQCVACKGKADVVHHIIMICNGGPNIRRNTVSLCKSCHTEVHPWLKEK